MKCPQQTNSSDCGVYLCLNMNLLAVDRPLDYDICSRNHPRSVEQQMKVNKNGTRRKRNHIKAALIRGHLDDRNDKDLGEFLEDDQDSNSTFFG